ncbi:unnamed protein product [Bemisia tabaci]|uniref:SAP domain-containing protein n=1 Tax=Bemisia tabaci TaxID=7038 RepID=A0A9P0F2P4_BEMTA|nr:unnamed protein product [Bemisia tabaci]
MSDEVLGVDYSKWKVPDLKKALKDLGLPTTGNKSELIERLSGKVESVSAGLDNREPIDQPEDIDEDEVLGADLDEPVADTNNDSIIDTPPEGEGKEIPKTTAGATPASSQKPSKKITLVRKSLPETEKENKDKNDENVVIINEKKKSEPEVKPSSERQVIKISTISMKERLEMRAQKFGTPLSDDAKKAARAERFGTPGGTKGSSSIGPTVVSSIEVLKKRAERFGCTTASKLVKNEMQEKLEQRAKRFKADPQIV